MLQHLYYAIKAWWKWRKHVHNWKLIGSSPYLGTYYECECGSHDWRDQ